MTAGGSIRVLLSDDHPIVRSGVRDLLSLSDRIEVIGEAGDGQEALDKAILLKPDVLLMDMEMPGLNGVEVARRLAGQAVDVRILALSAYDSIQFIDGILELGAYGYLTKEEMPEAIIEAVEGVACGQKGWLSARIRAKHEAWCQSRKQSEASATRLSKREKQVLTLIAEGLDNPTISERLFISLGTVKNHVTNIYNKLGLRTRAEAVTWAWENNLVERN